MAGISTRRAGHALRVCAFGRGGASRLFREDDLGPSHGGPGVSLELDGLRARPRWWGDSPVLGPTPPASEPTGPGCRPAGQERQARRPGNAHRRSECGVRDSGCRSSRSRTITSNRCAGRWPRDPTDGSSTSGSRRAPGGEPMRGHRRRHLPGSGRELPSGPAGDPLRSRAHSSRAPQRLDSRARRAPRFRRGRDRPPAAAAAASWRYQRRRACRSR